jgi:hypothetical protein
MNICVWKKNFKRLALSMLFQKHANIPHLMNLKNKYIIKISFNFGKVDLQKCITWPEKYGIR